MSKAEYAWVIQRDDGMLFCDIDITENGYKPYFTKYIEHCINNHSLFRTKELAQDYINRFLQNCRPHKVKIEIVGEDDE